MTVYVNGRFLPARKAVVSVFDHGFLYGDGVYETLRVYNGKVFLLERHLKRLAHSAQGIDLRLPLSSAAMGQRIQETVRRNGHVQAVVRVTLSRGPGPYGFDTRACTRPTLVISSMPFAAYPASFYTKGIRVAVVSVRRNAPSSLPPSVKSTNCLNGILAKMESIRLKADEGLFLTQRNYLAEGTVSNIFLVNQGRLFTPVLDGSLLSGVTRDWVCTLARRGRYGVSEKHLSLRDLMNADEIFITNTTMEVMPVREVRVSPLLGAASRGRRAWKGNGIGPVTRDLMALFQAALMQNAEQLRAN